MAINNSWITVDMVKQALRGGTGAALVAEVPSPLVDATELPQFHGDTLPSGAQAGAGAGLLFPHSF